MAAFDDGDIGDGGFGQFGFFVPEEDVVHAGAGGTCLFIDLAAGGFVIEEEVGGIDRSFGKTDAERSFGGGKPGGFGLDGAIAGEKEADALGLRRETRGKLSQALADFREVDGAGEVIGRGGEAI